MSKIRRLIREKIKDIFCGCPLIELPQRPTNAPNSYIKVGDIIFVKMFGDIEKVIITSFENNGDFNDFMFFLDDEKYYVSKDNYLSKYVNGNHFFDWFNENKAKNKKKFIRDNFEEYLQFCKEEYEKR